MEAPCILIAKEFVARQQDSLRHPQDFGGNSCKLKDCFTISKCLQLGQADGRPRKSFWNIDSLGETKATPICWRKGTALTLRSLSYRGIKQLLRQAYGKWKNFSKGSQKYFIKDFF